MNHIVQDDVMVADSMTFLMETMVKQERLRRAADAADAADEQLVSVQVSPLSSTSKSLHCLSC